MMLWCWQEFLPTSRLPRNRNPFTTRPLLRATVSFSSSLEFHRDNNPRRREEVDDGSEGGWQEESRGKRSRGSPCSRAMPLGRVERVSWEGGIWRIVLIKRPRNVGRWLNPVIDLEARAPGERRAREIFKFLHYSLKESLMLDGIARNIIIPLF